MCVRMSACARVCGVGRGGGVAVAETGFQPYHAALEGEEIVPQAFPGPLPTPSAPLECHHTCSPLALELSPLSLKPRETLFRFPRAKSPPQCTSPLLQPH